MKFSEQLAVMSEILEGASSDELKAIIWELVDMLGQQDQRIQVLEEDGDFWL